MTTPYKFSTQFRVRFYETDAQGHVNFAEYFNYFDVALIEYLRKLDYSYGEMVKEGVDLFYVDAHGSYNAPAYFDEILSVHCRVGRFGNTSLRFDFQAFGKDGRLLATGEITAVTAAPDTKAKIRVPERLRQAVAAFET